MVLRRTKSFVWVKLSMFTLSWPLLRQLRWSPWVLPWWSPLFVALSVLVSQLSFLPLLTLMLAASCILHVVPFSLLRVVQTLDCCFDKKFWCNHLVSVIFLHQILSPTHGKRLVLPSSLWPFLFPRSSYTRLPILVVSCLGHSDQTLPRALDTPVIQRSLWRWLF